MCEEEEEEEGRKRGEYDEENEEERGRERARLRPKERGREKEITGETFVADGTGFFQGRVRTYVQSHLLLPRHADRYIEGIEIGDQSAISPPLSRPICLPPSFLLLFSLRSIWLRRRSINPQFPSVQPDELGPVWNL